MVTSARNAKKANTISYAVGCGENAIEMEVGGSAAVITSGKRTYPDKAYRWFLAFCVSCKEYNASQLSVHDFTSCFCAYKCANTRLASFREPPTNLADVACASQSRVQTPNKGLQLLIAHYQPASAATKVLS